VYICKCIVFMLYVACACMCMLMLNVYMNDHMCICMCFCVCVYLWGVVYVYFECVHECSYANMYVFLCMCIFMGV
jgi:hypothetical protein